MTTSELLQGLDIASQLVDLPIYKNNKSVGQVLLKPLTHNDHIQIQRLSFFETDKIFGDKPFNRDGYLYIQHYNNIAAKHFVYRCCYDPENISKPFFPTVDSVAKRLSNLQVNAIMQMYLKFQESI